jgi:hypothetical protein
VFGEEADANSPSDGFFSTRRRRRYYHHHSAMPR